MKKVNIDFSSLVIVPLVILGGEISTKEIEFYVSRIEILYNINLTQVEFNLSKFSKLFFELTRYWWVDSKTNMDDETIYSFKDGVDYDTKIRLLNETSEDILKVLTDDYALEVFGSKTKKLLNNN